MRSKILITGGAGFIGSNLVHELYRRDYEVVVLDNCSIGNKICPDILSDITFIKADVRDANVVQCAAKGCDAIVHFAAVVGVDRVIERSSETISTETIGSQNIGNAAKLHGIKKVIYASSSGVYNNTKATKSREEDCLHLVNGYSIAKRLNELYFQALCTEVDIDTYSLRFFNVYGPGQDDRMVVPRFFNQAYTEDSIVVFGDGQQTRDFTYITDVLETICRFLEMPAPSGVYNVSTGIDIPILQLASLIKEITTSSSALKLQAFPKERLAFKVDRRVGCSQKIQTYLNYQPQVSLYEGLSMLAAQLAKPVLPIYKLNN